MSVCVEIRQLCKAYSRRKWLLGAEETIPVLQEVSLSLWQNRVLGLVGESGCGKSTLCKVLLGIEDPTSGTINVNGKNAVRVSREQRKKLCREMQAVFQDPYASLDPRMTVRQLLSEPLDIHGLYTDQSARQEFLAELLSSVGLTGVYLDRYPHEFSGGQRQRICIARALTLDPKILVADEPVSALDVSVQAQILNLFQDIKRARDLTMLFVTHDFAVARFLCDDIAVMYRGRIVESAPSEQLFAQPLHPYTRALLAAVPQVGKPLEKLSADAGGYLPPQSGCAFAPRCPYASSACRQVIPVLEQVTPEHACACIHVAKERV